jgi:hypothetical protein
VKSVSSVVSANKVEASVWMEGSMVVSAAGKRRFGWRAVWWSVQLERDCWDGGQCGGQCSWRETVWMEGSVMVSAAGERRSAIEGILTGVTARPGRTLT